MTLRAVGVNLWKTAEVSYLQISRPSTAFEFCSSAPFLRLNHRRNRIEFPPFQRYFPSIMVLDLAPSLAIVPVQGFA